MNKKGEELFLLEKKKLQHNEDRLQHEIKKLNHQISSVNDKHQDVVSKNLDIFRNKVDLDNKIADLDYSIANFQYKLSEVNCKNSKRLYDDTSSVTIQDKCKNIHSRVDIQKEKLRLMQDMYYAKKKKMDAEIDRANLELKMLITEQTVIRDLANKENSMRRRSEDFEQRAAKRQSRIEEEYKREEIIELPKLVRMELPNLVPTPVPVQVPEQLQLLPTQPRQFSRFSWATSP